MIMYKDIGLCPELVQEKVVECLHASIWAHLEAKRAANSAEFSA